MSEPVRIVFLGGLGEIGRNCMAIEQGSGESRSIVLIDCGLMFPDADMHGIDLVLPDFTYLREHANRIAGLVATHGHEDHVGGIQYLLRDHDGIGHLRDTPLPVYGAALTLGFARHRIEEAGLLGRIDLRPVARPRDGDDRSVPGRVHPRHPFGAARARDRRAHGTGRGAALRRLETRPRPGRRAAHRPVAPRPAHRGRRCASADGRLDQRRGARSRAERDLDRRCAAVAVRASTVGDGSSRRASPATCTGSSRSPTPRSATAARSRRSG